MLTQISTLLALVMSLMFIDLSTVTGNPLQEERDGWIDSHYTQWTWDGCVGNLIF